MAEEESKPKKPEEPLTELGPDQNFFDQEPFRSLLEEAARKSGAPLETFRRMLVKHREMLKRSVDFPERRDLILNEVVLESSGPPDDPFNEAFREVLQRLDPLAFEYLGWKLEPGIYSANGNVQITMKSDPSSFFPPLYTVWREKRIIQLEREKNQRLLGIEQVFGSKPSPTRAHDRARSNRVRIVGRKSA